MDIKTIQSQADKKTPVYCYVLLITLTAVLCTFFFALAAQYHTYTIVDGSIETTISSNATTPESVLDEAGVRLGHSDSFSVTGSSIHPLITVYRAINVTVNYAGTSTSADSTQSTVGGLLKELQIQLTGNDTIACLGAPVTTDARLYSGMCLDITTSEDIVKTTLVSMPYETETYLDPSLPEGQRIIKIEGSAGTRQVTTSSHLVNGEITETDITSSVVLDEPVNRIVFVGGSISLDNSFSQVNETDITGTDSFDNSTTESDAVTSASPAILPPEPVQTTDTPSISIADTADDDEVTLAEDEEADVNYDTPDFSYSYEPEPEPEPAYSEPSSSYSYDESERTSAYSSENTIVLEDGTVLTYSDTMTVTATAYCGGGTTATGTPARYGAIAVDPTVIPYGTRMYIETADGSWIYGVATAEDCGGAIQGNIIDLYFDDYDTCIQFGRRTCIVYFLD